ncbi:unnamed protein product [Brassicogethes aeneus]|uniref:Uncharacterized protein n=1 Tax=Brassicogethes aeneus TaxID=1431903 RepID=A0A9P0BEN5_BRAAE|nr:unnamed protein product [Brassicogethes aeneus]
MKFKQHFLVTDNTSNMNKFIVVLLVAFCGAALADKSVLVPALGSIFPLKKKVHEDIIKANQIKIDELSNEVLKQSKLAAQILTHTTTVLKSDVENSAETLDQDISNIKVMINQQFKKPKAIGSRDVRNCLSVEVILVEALNTNKIRACYDTKTIAELTKNKNDILALRPSVNSIGESCRQQHPLESDSAGMETCITNNLTTSTSLLNERAKELETKINDLKANSATCIQAEEQGISAESNAIPGRALACL